VYETSVDNIIGVVPMKELLNRIASTDYPETSMDIASLPVRDVMMPAYYVPDTMPLSTLLEDFTSNRRQIAIVLDEYGGTEGLITLEDILEEIVGDYEDEFTPRHRHIRKEGEHNFVINGGVRVTELEPKLHYPFPSGDYVTLGGLIHHRLGRIAAVGDVLLLEGARLEVLEMDNHRITRVLFQDSVLSDTNPDPDTDSDATDQDRILSAESPGDSSDAGTTGPVSPDTGSDKILDFDNSGIESKSKRHP
jgi:CBS domain containing-hemolysin-like protein